MSAITPSIIPAITQAEITHRAQQLSRHIAGEVLTDATTRWLYSTDTSIYQMQPEMVVVPKSIEDLKAVVQFAADAGLPITPRGGGTSLAGQAVGAGIQIDVSKYLNQILDIDPSAGVARVQPGVILEQFNQALAPTRHWFGPDVAPANRATLGGMIGNNSAGARSIIYGKTVDHVLGLKTLWSDGSSSELGAVDDAAWQQKCRLNNREGDIYRCVDRAIEHHGADIEKAFPNILRRVSGYNLDAFLPSRRKLKERRNLAHLLTGSEGTLGLWHEATVRIVHRPAHSGLMVMYFDTVADALEANHAIIQTGPSAAELLDDMLLDLTRQNAAYARKLYFMEQEAAVILVVQYLADSATELQHKLQQGARFAREQQLCQHVTLTDHPTTQADIWAIRKAGMPLLYSRPGDYKPITFIEDTAVTPEKLRPFIEEFDALIQAHDTEAAYYAHASVGCLHIRPLINLKTVSEVKKMRSLAEGVVNLVQKYNGAMSGEHGDGLARSEFNERLFGPVVYGLFQQLKHAADPKGLMNPGKIVNGPPMDQQLRYGETYQPQALNTVFNYSSQQQSFQHLVEQCNGCGGCRKLSGGTMCPPYRVTRDEKDSTRGRANALRRLLLDPETLTQGEPEAELKQVMELCIGCKACKAECPSQVDMAKLKSEYLYRYQQRHGMTFRDRLFSQVKWLNHAGALTAPLSNTLLQNRWFRRGLSHMLGISAQADLPRFASVPFDFLMQRHMAQKQPNDSEHPAVVLFNDCYMNYNHPQVGMAAVRVLEALGYQVIVPPQVCCGRPQLSLGRLDQARASARRVWQTLQPFFMPDTQQTLPVVGLEPSCVLSFGDEYLNLTSELTPREQEVVHALANHSSTLQTFLQRVLQERRDQGLPLPFRALHPLEHQQQKQVFFHEHCHQKALEGNASGEQILRQVFRQIGGLELIPSGAGCCGMAGSFGYESEHESMSQRMAEQALLPALQAAKLSEQDTVAVSGMSCRHQLQKNTSHTVKHWIEVLAEHL